MTEALERWRPGAIAGLGGAVSALPLAAIPFVPLLGDVIAGVVCVAGLVATGWLFTERRRIGQLPLELAAAAARGRVDGVDVYRFRARLGRGRRMRRPEVTVTWRPADGAPVPLAVALPVDDLCGPWTIVASDPAGVVRGPGALHLEVRVDSAGQPWRAAASYELEAVPAGRFDQGLQLGRRGLEWSDAWDRVTLDQDGTPDESEREPELRP